MPKLPILQGGSTSREMIDVFAGYNHNLKIRDGELFHTENLTTEYYPVLASRKRRYTKDQSFTNLRAIIDDTGWIDDGTVYLNGEATGLTGLSQIAKQLVKMGSYLCIFPDKKYINLSDKTDYGSMGASWSYTGSITYSMCQQDGTIYSRVTKSGTAPANPLNGDIWIDSTEGAVKEYSSYSETWTVLETVYTRLDFDTQGELPDAFKEYDGVEIEGLHFDDLNGSKILYAVGGVTNLENDWAVLIGIQEEAYTEQSASITVTREIPDLDYVCEAQNRLWGCFYGKRGEESVNEIYCCALGDFRNWSQYLGLSTDSWRASCGSEGSWTGCINYMGTPTFFKDNRIHPVSVSSVGAHQVGDIPARGVQRGCSKSLAVVQETLFYKSVDGVMAYQGGLPVSVSAALGDVQYYYAAAGSYGHRYYISMKDDRSPKYDVGNWNLFVYDAGRGLWMREDSLHVSQFVTIGSNLLGMCEEYEVNKSTGIVDTFSSIKLLNDGEPGKQWTEEEPVRWAAETGIQHYEYPDKKYVSRYNVRLYMEKGAEVRLFIEYDSKGTWIYEGKIKAGDVMTDNTGTATVPVRPRRCDHLRIRLAGTGDVKILSIVRVLQKGSDR